MKTATRRKPRSSALDFTMPARPWTDDVIALVNGQHARDRWQPLSLPAVYAALRRQLPGLTLGQYHDGLRELHDQGRVRLLPFTRALATIEDPRNAIFLDGEVMVYVALDRDSQGLRSE